MIESKIKTCQNCKQEFRIEPEDFEFYKKIDVPEPTFCPECREQRRLASRNERNLYRRKCDLCKKEIISMYSPDKLFPVYCLDCYFSDKWNVYEFGQDIDFKKTFFEQYQELQNKTPRLSFLNYDCINSEYSNYAARDKDCYLCFRIGNSENCLYSYFILNSKDLVDCFYVRKSELLYGCFECRESYNCRYLIESKGCHDCAYSYNLNNCSNCLFCWNLKNKQYYVENKKVSSKEFKEVWLKYVSGLRKKHKEADEKLVYIYNKKAIHKYNKIINSQNVSGVNITNSKNIHLVYNCNESEDLRYGDSCEMAKDGMDFIGPMKTEFFYEVCSADYNCYKVFFTSFAEKECRDIWYSSFIMNSQNCFGCISLRNAKNCILNKQYSPEKYDEFKKKLIEHMRQTREFGENFPISSSPFAYNESIAIEDFFIKKEDAIKKGYNWQDNLPGVYGKETLKQKEIPDDIKQVSDNIIDEIIFCKKCGKNYKIVKSELNFYKKYSIPIPEYCFDCRYTEQLKRYRLSKKLFNRICTCQEKNHQNHFNKNCINKFKSPYSKKYGPENVWCEECYKYLF